MSSRKKSAGSGLISQIGKLSPRSCSGSGAFEVMKRANPQAYAELVEVIVNFNKGGKVAEVFPTVSSLWRYLSGKDADAPIAAKISVTLDSFHKFVRKLRDE
jgi:hypothetical protein